MNDSKGRILIVDDEFVVRDSLTQWFSAEGYLATAADSGRAALAAIGQAEYDLALLDIKMPGMDGMELQERLVAADPELTVVMMTGYATVETAVRALKQGAYDYITKPVDPDELTHLVAQGDRTPAHQAGKRPPAGEPARHLPAHRIDRQQPGDEARDASSSRWSPRPTRRC